MSHRNRSKKRIRPDSNPWPAQIRAARERAGDNVSQAAERVYTTPRIWEEWEVENATRRMPPALYELYELKAGGLVTWRPLPNSPEPWEIEAAREHAKLEIKDAAKLVHVPPGYWQSWENRTPEHRMHAGVFELFLHKTNQIEIARQRRIDAAKRKPGDESFGNR